VVPGVEIRLVSPDTQAEYATETGPAGQYDIRGVPAGDYLLMIVMPGFRTVERPVSLTGLLALDPVLDVGGLEETLTVTASGGAQVSFRSRRPSDERLAPTCEDTSVGGVILPPLKLLDVHPVYPPSEAGSRVTGEVILDATIGRDGFVNEASVLETTSDAFAASAIDAVRRWQFSPTYLNCVPVDVSMTVYVSFTPE
jgi:TonB family protein